MKRRIIIAVGLGTAWMLTGCVGVAIGNREGKAGPHPSTTVIVASDPGDQASIAEIDAAAGLSNDQGRRDALAAIAARPGLTAPAQVQLVNTTYARLDFDASKVTVLLAVVKNPGFCAPARQTMMAQLSKLASDRDREAILSAVNTRESKK